MPYQYISPLNTQNLIKVFRKICPNFTYNLALSAWLEGKY